MTIRGIHFEAPQEPPSGKRELLTYFGIAVRSTELLCDACRASLPSGPAVVDTRDLCPTCQEAVR